MKRQVCMVTVALAALMLLLVPFIPHHHHDYALCAVVEHCDSDNTDNDKHTRHNDDGTACMEKGGVFVSKSKAHNDIPCKIILAFAHAMCGMANAELFTVKKFPREWECVAMCQSADFNRANALRAPPTIIF